MKNARSEPVRGPVDQHEEEIETVTDDKRPTSADSKLESQPQGALLFPALTGAEESWFALYVQVNHEKEVAKRLQQKSINNFLPLMECWSKRKDRRKKIHIPLFPGYVFVHTVLDNYTNVNILKTPGALTVLRNSEGPLPIPDYQIENLQTMLESRQALSIHQYLQQGDWVRVVRGHLTGCIGILVRQNPKKGRLVVSIDIIQKSVGVELDMEDVEPLEAPLL
ncbi:MAG: UpxY family transcription antiterminator [Desulforhabdus sp.]|jgi:transcription antitermination factor NusG|nr:UpxY family transcription antiterminator [Desulforhabdus sp.]